MTTGSFEHTATLLPNGKVLIVGGAFDEITGLGTAELYDPATGTFTATGTMTAARCSHTATLLPNGLVLIAGGQAITELQLTAELYDPAAGTFTATGTMTTGRFAGRFLHTATLLPNGLVLIAGGEMRTLGSSQVLASAELYNPATGTFTATGNMATTKEYHTATLLPNGQVLIAGGQQGDVSALASAELYNPAVGTFTATGTMPVATWKHTATLLPNGQVLVTGGRVQWTLAGAELYDPAAGTFTATGTMTTARYSHAATLLLDGLVLITGGQGGLGPPLESAELYDPAVGTFTAAGTMNGGRLGGGRFEHTATLLGDGKVLIAGGNESFPSLATAELYE
jgi:hypothetical protein